MDIGGTQKNEPKDKEIDDDAKCLTPKRWHRYSLYVKKRREKMTRLILDSFRFVSFYDISTIIGYLIP